MSSQRNAKMPGELSLQTGNVAENWRKWNRTFDYYRRTIKVPTSDVDAVAILLNVAGEEAQDVYDNFTYTAEESKEDFDTVWKKFKEYCLPKKNTIYERYTFNNRRQEESETIERYVTVLKKLASTCEYGELKEELVRDRLVCGVKNKKLSEKMLGDRELTLQSALDYGRSYETTRAQASEMHPEASENIDFVDKRSYHSQPDGTKFNKSSSRKRFTSQDYDCKKCGTRHAQRSCPAYRSTCFKCDGRGHYSKYCPGKSKVRTVMATNNANGDSQYDSQGSEEEQFQIKTVNAFCTDNNNSDVASCDKAVKHVCVKRVGSVETPVKPLGIDDVISDINDVIFCECAARHVCVKRVGSVEIQDNNVPLNLTNHMTMEHSDEESRRCNLIPDENSLIHTINSASRWIHPLEIGGIVVPMKLDTGAGANLINISDYYSLKQRPAIRRSKMRLSDYNNKPIDVHGECIISCKFNGVKQKVLFIVVKDGPVYLAIGVVKGWDW